MKGSKVKLVQKGLSQKKIVTRLKSQWPLNYGQENEKLSKVIH